MALTDYESIFETDLVSKRRSIAGYTTERTDQMDQKETVRWQNVTHYHLLINTVGIFRTHLNKNRSA